MNFSRILSNHTPLDFKSEFRRRLAGLDPSFAPKGIITSDRRIFPLGSDTKVLSSIFEAYARPIVYNIASDFGLTVREAQAQNKYPDFTLMRDVDDNEKIGVDVKTTYREAEEDWTADFTLGGYRSSIGPGDSPFIEFPYDDYDTHWVVGYIYWRSGSRSPPDDVYSLDEIADIPVPVDDVDVFVQKRWKIAGDTAGSGNTANIGSIRGTLEDFREGRGVFDFKEEYLAYWRNYEQTAAERQEKFNTIEEFREWWDGTI